MKNIGLFLSIFLMLSAYATANVAYAGSKEHEDRKELKKEDGKKEESKEIKNVRGKEDHDGKKELEKGIPHPVKLSNLSDRPLKDIEIKFSGKDPRDFRQTNDCGEELGGKTSCTINVTFVPKTPGVKTAAMEIRTSGGSKTIYLSGTGI